MGRRQILIFALVAASACQTAGVARVEPLPHTVAILARTRQDSSVSVLVAVQPNERGTLDVRVAEGVVIPARDRVLAVRSIGPTPHVMSELDAKRTDFTLPGEGWTFTGLGGGDAYFRRVGAGVTCALRSGVCVDSPFTQPEPALSHPGPGHGFRLSLSADGDLRFALPHDGEGEGSVILAGVERIAGVQWIRDRASPQVQEYVDRTFRGRAALVASPLAVTVDGELGEWNATEPAVVEAPWQLDVREGWTGPDDASFSVAAAVSGEELCFAGRLRDDVVTADDTLVVNVAAQRHRISMIESTESAVVAPEWFGHRFELCIDMPPVFYFRQSVPLGVSYRDDDGDGTGAVLSTAPRMGSWSAGMLSLLPAVKPGG